MAASALVLIPCFWQARIQAGDLGSHIYNAWLAQLVRQGKAPGLALVPQTTNVLFDILLGTLFHAFGAAAAQRIAVSLAVLVLVWGGFAFAAALGRKPWDLLPCLGMLAYGWVFHMGLFNFYLSLGLCLWTLALAWESPPRRSIPRLAAAALLLALAYTAHGLPAAWAVAILAYLWMLRRGAHRYGHLFAMAVLALVLTHMAMSLSWMTRWSWAQIRHTAGADQFWVFGGRFLAVTAGVGLLWVLLFATLIRRQGARKVLSSEPFHICALTGAGIFLVQSWVWIPRYQHALVFISERMSLAQGMCLCALLSAVPMRVWQRYALAALALVFLAFLYDGERRLNAFEDQVEALLAQLPTGQRVLSSVASPPDLQIDGLTHIIDRACIGRCYSFANYEPSSGQFRIRVRGPETIVAPTDMDSSRMQIGQYVVTPSDLPLYQVDAGADGHLTLRSLPAGRPNGQTIWSGW